MTSPNPWRRSKFCDTGGCLEIQVDGQSVSLREDANPEHVVVTSLASWETWRAEAKVEERAAIAARLGEHYLAQIICDHETRRDNPVCSCSLVHLGWHPSVGAAVAAWIDHALADDDELEDEFPVSMTFDDTTGRWGDGRLAAGDE